MKIYIRTNILNKTKCQQKNCRVCLTILVITKVKYSLVTKELLKLGGFVRFKTNTFKAIQRSIKTKKVP